ncbi:hypothetical protein [Streptomyces noursei]|uniref:hypothetical protein n=1 Tax=Streptomyces noursei TaxID=1971 RepID=UPI00082CE963
MARSPAGFAPCSAESWRAPWEMYGGCDIVAELFKPLPSFVVGRYLGVPEADRASAAPCSTPRPGCRRPSRSCSG